MAQEKNGKPICIITGATDGIGKRTAEVLARKGYDLALVGRDGEKGLSVVSELQKQTGQAAIRFFKADLSSVKQVKKLSEDIQSAYDHIDVLINNAGAYFHNFKKTSEENERTFALNHLAYFQLTNRLIPLLSEAPAGRIVNVASNAHFRNDLDFENLQGLKNYSGWTEYCRSKLSNIMFTYELHERLKDENLTVNALHPGFVKSQFGMNNQGFFKGLLSFSQKLFAISIEEGARTSIYLASDSDVEGISGLYFYKCKAVSSSKQSKNIAKQRKLWQKSEELIAAGLSLANS
ncbi:MAG: SDR family oxidoreductase [Candidatus Neomarinimicrobiota bacterium]